MAVVHEELRVRGRRQKVCHRRERAIDQTFRHKIPVRQEANGSSLLERHTSERPCIFRLYLLQPLGYRELQNHEYPGSPISSLIEEWQSIVLGLLHKHCSV